MIAVITASGLGKQFRRTWALRDCTLAIPDGHVVGLEDLVPSTRRAIPSAPPQRPAGSP